MKATVPKLDSIMKWLWRAVEFLAWLAFFAVAAAVLALRYWLLPDIERYRDDITAAVAYALGQPVSIGGIEAGWLGLRPQISLSDVRLYDPQGRPALELPRVENVLSWRSLLDGRLKLHSLIIDRPRLSVRLDKAGALHVAGMQLSQDGGGEPRVPDWILAQEEVVIRDAEIEWRDERRGAPPLSLSSFHLKMRNSGEQHSLGLAALPPPALGARFELRAELRGRSAADLAAWNGRVYAEFGYTDLAAWRTWLDYPVDVWHGQGALRVWGVLEGGQLRQATADVALAHVTAYLGEDLAPLELDSVRGRLQGSAKDGNYELAAQQLALTLAPTTALPPLDFKLTWRSGGTNGGTADANGTLSVNQLELRALAELAEELPLPAQARRVVLELAPRGKLVEPRLEWRGSPVSPQRVFARARSDDVGVRPRERVPGFAGLSGTLEATEQRGSVVLEARKAELDLPRVFPEPRVALESLAGRIDWERQEAGVLSVRLSSIAFANQHLAGTASGVYFHTGSGPGIIDLTAAVERADGRQLERYLPRPELMGAATRAWLVSSVLEGQVSDVQVRLQGDLANFPFTDAYAGQFRIAGRVQKGVLAYAKGWPRIEGIDAELLFERDRMEIVGRSGSILGVRLANVHVSIPRIAAGAQLHVKGQADGPTGEFLDYLSQSPVGGMIGGAAEDFSASGRARLRLALDLPLADLAAARVAGELELLANRVTLHPLLPPVGEASGRLSFTESSFAVHDLQGRFLGGPVAIAGGMRPGAPLQIVAKGTAAVGEARALFDHPWQRELSGAAAYTARISVRERHPHVVVESPLLGVASALPAPLAKRAEDAMPLRVEVLTAESGARDRISIVLGKVAQAELVRRRQGAAMGVQRAGVRLSPGDAQPVRLARSGVLVYGALPALDLDAWLPLLSERDAGAGSLALDVRVGTLDLYGRRLNEVATRAGADAGGWTANVKARELSGELGYRGADGGRLTMRLAHFNTPDSYPGGEARSADPRSLPALEFVAERFSHRGREYGRVELDARPFGPDWRIERFAMANDQATLQGEGVWRSGAPTRVILDFKLEAKDAGGFLGRAGYPNLVARGKAHMQAALAWNGEPASIDWPSLSGTLQLQAEDGQFLEVEPGLGKLISLMSLQALPRRLQLDFRDVFSKGFQFERIAAASRIDGGVMTLQEFRMRGSAARVEMTGSIDLARETQELRARVLPSVGDSASTVLAFFNPILVFPAALAQRILKDPLGHIFAFDYSIVGSWADPKVERIGVDARPVEHAFPE
jgi:uncharacterized protein (TIGR02099 family)